MADRIPHDALKAIAHTYVTFGEANVEIYHLMSASRLTPQTRAATRQTLGSMRSPQGRGRYR